MACKCPWEHTFYLTVLVFVGLQSFAGQLAEEGDKGLRQALFMVGLDEGVYWASWVILSTKLFITTMLVHCSCSSCAIVQLCRHADSFHSCVDLGGSGVHYGWFT